VNINGEIGAKKPAIYARHLPKKGAVRRVCYWNCTQRGVHRQQDQTMTRDDWNRLINSLLCVRLGQELGTSSDLAQAVAGAVETLIRVAAIFSP